MTVNVKTLIKQALDAQIQGNKEGFTGALKQVMAVKVQKLVAEGGWSWNKQNLPYGTTRTGMDSFHLVEVETDDGELIEVDVTVKHFIAPTQGTFNKRADNPSEYYGDPMEFELQIDSAQTYDEDGNKLPLLTGDAAKAVITSDMYEDMWNRVAEYIEKEEPDNDPY